jgi:hypothetical protein
MIFDSSGLEMRKIHALGKRALLLKAAGPNDFASFEVDIKEPGEYEFSSVLFASPLYGAVSALVDGKIIAGPIDRYAKSAEVKEFVHGNIRLTKGKHIIKYVCNGKNSASSGCYMGIASILLRKKQEASDKVSKTEAPALPVKGENFCGLEIKDSDLDYKFIFNTTDAENIQTDKGLAFSGRIGGVALDDKNKIKRYFLLNGKTLKYNERILAKSELPCKISFMEDDGSMEALVETTIEGRNKVSLWMPGGKSVTVNGKSVDLNDSYKKGVFEIPCEKGKFVIKAKLGE